MLQEKITIQIEHCTGTIIQYIFEISTPYYSQFYHGFLFQFPGYRFMNSAFSGGKLSTADSGYLKAIYVSSRWRFCKKNATLARSFLNWHIMDLASDCKCVTYDAYTCELRKTIFLKLVDTGQCVLTNNFGN